MSSQPAPHQTDLHEDEIRIMRAAQRDPSLFAPLYERYFDRIYAYCLRRTSNAQEAEDLTSQVFTRVLTALQSYRGGMVAAWLFQIAHNIVINHYRGRRPILSLDDLDLSGDDEGESALEQIARAEEGRVLQQLIAALPDDHRTLLSLAIDAGLNSYEIGAALGKNPTTVRVQIHRIIKQLRERFIDWERRQ